MFHALCFCYILFLFLFAYSHRNAQWDCFFFSVYVRSDFFSFDALSQIKNFSCKRKQFQDNFRRILSVCGRAACVKLSMAVKRIWIFMQLKRATLLRKCTFLQMYLQSRFFAFAFRVHKFLSLSKKEDLKYVRRQEKKNAKIRPKIEEIYLVIIEIVFVWFLYWMLRSRSERKKKHKTEYSR